MRYLLLSIIALVSYNFSLQAYTDQTVFMGTIQFPTTVQHVPPIRIYHMGKKITDFEIQGRSILYHIAVPKQRTSFMIVFTEHIALNDKKPVQYLSIPSNTAYSCFLVEQVRQIAPRSSPHAVTQYVTTGWKINKVVLPKDHQRIPDDALIIVCNPDYVQSIEGGSDIELPRIIIKDNIIALAGGTHEKLNEHAAALLLELLDFDAFHVDNTLNKRQVQASKSMIFLEQIEA